MDVYGLTNLIKGPTCFKSVLSPTSVDVILSPCPKSVISTLNTDIGVRDSHSMILAATRVYISSNISREIMYRSYKNFRGNSFLSGLNEAPLHVSSICDNCDDQLWFHNKLLNEVINKHAPLKKRKLKPHQLPCMNGELRRAINVKGMLRRKFDKFKSVKYWQLFKAQRNKVTSLKRNCQDIL